MITAAKEVIVLSSGKNIARRRWREYLKSVYIKEICLVPRRAIAPAQPWRGCWHWSIPIWISFGPRV
jgi:hypothetical protein